MSGSTWPRVVLSQPLLGRFGLVGWIWVLLKNVRPPLCHLLDPGLDYRLQLSDVAGSVDSEILLKEVLRQHVTLAAHNPSDNHGRGELGGEIGVRMLLPLGHGCEVTARRLQLMLNPKKETPGHLECEAKDLATWGDLWIALGPILQRWGRPHFWSGDVRRPTSVDQWGRK